MRVLCDFDGTISRVDATDLVLSRLARPGWEEIEAQWAAGSIGSARCMQEQIRLIDASPEDLHAVLDTVELDSGFVDLVSWCKAHLVPLRIISDGVDFFVHQILKGHGFKDLSVTANQLRQIGPRSWRLETEPGAACLAGSGVCKCQVAENVRNERVVFIGDGRSDFCVAKAADILFAKDRLMDWCRQRQIAFHPYATLSDVAIALDRLAPRVQPRLKFLS